MRPAPATDDVTCGSSRLARSTRRATPTTGPGLGMTGRGSILSCARIRASSASDRHHRMHDIIDCVMNLIRCRIFPFLSRRSAEPTSCGATQNKSEKRSAVPGSGGSCRGPRAAWRAAPRPESLLLCASSNPPRKLQPPTRHMCRGWIVSAFPVLLEELRDTGFSVSFGVSASGGTRPALA